MSSAIVEDTVNFEALALSLEHCPDYKVLRRIPAPVAESGAVIADEKFALIVDTETTGLDLREDEVIEIGFLLVHYRENRILSTREFGNELREPSKKIPEKIQLITGITPEKLKGKSIDAAKVLAAVSRANIVIAHNAAFDRPMCERLFPEFKHKPWACTLREIDWAGYGFESAKLKYLLLESGYFFDGHRALDDCVALEKLLSLETKNGNTYFDDLMESARTPSVHFYVNSPYELRSEIAAMGYRWNSQEGRLRGRWEKSVRLSQFTLEMELLETLKKSGVQYDTTEEDAFSRYAIK